MSNRPKGDFMPHPVPGLRPRKLPPYAKRQPEVSNGCMVLFILFMSMVFSLTATKCAAQTRFEFTSEMVQDHTDNTVYEAAVYIHAYADTLSIIFPAKRGVKPVNLLFWGIDWIWTDSGALYYNSATGDWRGRYTPGTGELWISTGELNMSIYRKKTIRL